MRNDLFLREGEYFVSDLGGEILPSVNGMEVGRYAVWRSAGEQYQLVEVGSDLAALAEKYGVSMEKVGRVSAE